MVYALLLISPTVTLFIILCILHRKLHSESFSYKLFSTKAAKHIKSKTGDIKAKSSKASRRFLDVDASEDGVDSMSFVASIVSSKSLKTRARAKSGKASSSSDNAASSVDEEEVIQAGSKSSKRSKEGKSSSIKASSALRSIDLTGGDPLKASSYIEYSQAQLDKANGAAGTSLFPLAIAVSLAAASVVVM